METMISCYSEISNTGFTSVLEELPYWSAPSGLELLNTIQLRSNLKVLDTGSGSGYQMIELAQRLGNSSIIYGMEQEDEAFKRIIQIRNKYHLNNIEPIKGGMEKLPFADQYFDLIVSNIGMRNLENLDLFFAALKKVAKPSAQLVISLHLQDAMMAFYRVMEDVLISQNMFQEIEVMKAQIYSRQKPLQAVEIMLNKAGFSINEIKLKEFFMTFLDGTTFFNHRLIRNGFLPDWRNIMEEKDKERIFNFIELKINNISSTANEFRVSVPFAVLNCLNSCNS